MLTALVMALAMGSENYVCWKQAGKTRCVPEGNRVEHGQHTGRSGGRGGGPGFAFFEFAPASGAGLSAACACTAVTGAKGETVSWTRGSSAYCTKEGLATTGLTTTSMVSCGNNLPRVEADNGGVLGVLAESSRTNLVLRSEEVDNAAWVKEFDSAPRTMTITANFATAPNNTLTADRVQFPATAAGEYSDFYQTFSAGVAGDPTTCSAYVQGTSGAGTLDICRFDGTTWGCSACSFVAGSITRCSTSAAGVGSTTRYCKLGNNTLQNGSVARAASDVLVWGAQGELSAYATSYIPTTTAGVTRYADGPVQAAGVTLTSLASAGSMAISVSPMNVTNPQAPLVFMAGSGRPAYANSFIAAFDGTNAAVIANGLTLGVAERYWSSWTGAALQINNATDATNNTVAFDGAMATTGPLEFGANAAIGTNGDWIVSRLCLDPVATRCR